MRKGSANLIPDPWSLLSAVNKVNAQTVSMISKLAAQTLIARKPRALDIVERVMSHQEARRTYLSIALAAASNRIEKFSYRDATEALKLSFLAQHDLTIDSHPYYCMTLKKCALTRIHRRRRLNNVGIVLLPEAHRLQLVLAPAKSYILQRQVTLL